MSDRKFLAQWGSDERYAISYEPMLRLQWLPSLYRFRGIAWHIEKYFSSASGWVGGTGWTTIRSKSTGKSRPFHFALACQIGVTTP
jgi:hypothetical protein